jgi:tryptophanyl-tRNA synthetase
MANLAVILGALTERSPIAALFGLHGANELKRAVAAAVESHLRPVRQRYADLSEDAETMRRLVEPSHDGGRGQPS